jgi:hypothetical protein
MTGVNYRFREPGFRNRLTWLIKVVMAVLVTAIHANELRESCRKNQEFEQILRR